MLNFIQKMVYQGHQFWRLILHFGISYNYLFELAIIKFLFLIYKINVSVYLNYTANYIY